MTRTTGTLVAVASLVLLAACGESPIESSPAQACASGQSPEEQVWATVDVRNSTWLSDDFDGHMAMYHPDFRRWSVSQPSLMTRDSFADLWSRIKANERVLSLEVLPEELTFAAEGQVAIAHYTIDEQFEWIAEDRIVDGVVERRQGEVTRGNLRFSDVFVFEDCAWLYIGGHRDGMALEQPEQ